MQRYDLSPLFRSTVGFDHLSQLIDSAFKMDADGTASYTPYNIAKTAENHYEIVLAVAGFSEQDLEIDVHQNTLTVRGAIAKASEPEEKEYLYRGIAGRSFERRYSLADHVKVVSAALKDGLLSISLKQEVPEADMPQRIAIHTGGTLIEHPASNKKKAA